MISVAEASARILEGIQRLSAESVDTERCVGRVLAQRVIAPTTSPRLDNSSMDGYAVRSADLNAGPLRVVETIPAGGFASRSLEQGEAMRIMTGAPVPEGADSVIRKEDTDEGRELVTIRDTRDSLRNIRKAGEDFREGHKLFDDGEVLGIAHLGALASAGIRSVSVHRVPRVAIVSSGDELIELEDYTSELEGKKIVSANSITLAELVRHAGGEPLYLGIANDTPESMEAMLTRAKGCDLLITSAGISVGDHDHVRDSIVKLGGEIVFWKVRMRPGAPLAFGTLHGAPWIGLSGNPVSAIVTFEIFVRPVIRKMLGMTRLFKRTIPVTLTESVKLAAPLMHFLRVVITRGIDNSFTAKLADSQSSAVLTSMARANALLIVPFDKVELAAGEKCLALPVGDEMETATTLDLT